MGQVVNATHKFSFSRRMALSWRLIRLVRELENAQDLNAKMLVIDELREVHRLIGRPTPDLALLGQSCQQHPLDA